MVDTKVTTVIVNATKQGLTMKVGNCHCYAKLTSVKVGGEYKMKMDVNWTYREFVVEGKSRNLPPLFLSSDDCCDYERITIQEDMAGEFDVRRDLRKQFRLSSRSASEEESSSSPVSSWKSWLYKFMYVKL